MFYFVKQVCIDDEYQGRKGSGPLGTEILIDSYCSLSLGLMTINIKPAELTSSWVSCSMTMSFYKLDLLCTKISPGILRKIAQFE